MQARISSLWKNIAIISQWYEAYGLLWQSKLLNTLVPAATLLQYEENMLYEFIIIHVQSSEQKIIRNGIHFEIYDDWSQGIPGYTIFFIYKMFDILYQEDNLIAFHASAVSLNWKGILFVGNPGSGKTWVMLNLVLHHGAKFISNNRTVIRNWGKWPEIIWGTQSISIRKEDVMRYHKFISPNVIHEISVTGFQLFHPDELSIQHIDPEQSPLKLDLIIFVELKDWISHISHLNWESAVYRAYENISKTQWGECLLFNGKLPAPILEKMEGPEIRLDHLRELLKTTTSVSIKWWMDFTIEQLQSLTQK